MTRANANSDLDNARADLVLALADLSAGDPAYKAINDIIARLDVVIHKTE